MPRRSIRSQLTQWYALVMLAGLCLFGTVSYFALQNAIINSTSGSVLRREARLFTYLHQLKTHGDSRNWLIQLQDYAATAPDGRLIQIYTIEGKRIFPLPGASDLDISWPNQTNCRNACFGQATVLSLPIRTMRHDVVIDGQTVRLCVAGSLHEQFDILARFRTAMLWSLPTVMILAILGGSLLSARALKPVDRMTRAALGIGITNLSKRIHVEQTGDELQRLGETWNDLFARLEDAVTRQQQFTSDASHDLRTSIAVILATGQLTLRHQRTEDEYREAIATMVSECESTSHLLEDLLLLARGNAFPAKLELLPVNISALVKEVAQRAAGLASSKMQQMEVYTPPHNIQLLGDSRSLSRLLSILIDNAVKYTPNGGTIRVLLAPQSDGSLHLSVQDTGIGIPPELLHKIFDRFYRADPVRNRNSGGFGLGLAIAQWIVNAHSAEINVTSNLNQGTTFSVRFPQYLTDSPLGYRDESIELLASA
ncbi:MAG TPA: ATP-binding protein [Granulicella sp.]|jgi:two-component system heavy metal sensor histidine kinase CusS|nr:ATP-binding protein [Granulicella sp.]